MPQVKLKIEVNGGTTASGFNVSADKSANNVGFSSMPQSFDDSFKGTRLLTLSARADANKTIFINSQGYLVNNQDDEEAGQLQSEQNKRQFVYGKTDANAEYELTLTMTTDTGTFDRIVIVGDSVGMQFPIEAIVDGATTIYSDDPYWAIDLGDKQSSHTIKFTKWNKANYNACFNQVKIMLQYYEVDRFNGLKQVESLSQSTPDASSIYYGTLANSGSAEIVDVDGEIEDMINDGILDNSNVPVELYIDNHLVQSHITNDSDYTPDKILNLQFTNKIEYWDKITYSGYAYTEEQKTAYEMLYDVLDSLGYEQSVDDMLSEQIIFGNDNSVGTIKSYLQLITIPYPYLPSDTYRNTIDKFCRLAQLQVYQKDNGDIKFISARPVVSQSQKESAIVVPKYAQVKNLNKTIILKNKYDAVEINEKNVQNQYEYDASVLNKTEDVDTYSFSSGYFASGTQMRARIDAYYTSGTFFVPQTEDLGKIKYVSFGEKMLFSGNNKNVYSRTEHGSLNLIKSPNINDILSDTNTPLDFETMKSYISGGSVSEGTKYSNNKVYNYEEIKNVIIYKEQDANINYNDYTMGFFLQYKPTSKQILFSSHNHYDSIGTVTSSFTDNSSITITEVTGGYNISYNVLSKLFLCGYYFHYYQGSTRQDYFISEKASEQILFTIYGDKRTLVFEDVSASDDTSSAKTIATVQGSELLQTGTKYNNSTVMSTLIKDNIKSDYVNGLSNGDIELFCLDYKDANNDKVINFNNGEILENSNVLSIEGDNKTWQVTGRQFKYDGQSTTNIEVKEVKPVTTWEDVFTYQKQWDSTYKITGMKDLLSENVVVPNYHNGKIVNRIRGINNFNRKTEIETIKLPDSITTIEAAAFEGCTSLTSINIPNSVDTIDFYAFQDCTSLTSVTIPSSVTYMAEGIFKNCSGLTEVYIYADTNTDSSSIDPSYIRSFFYGCSSSLVIHIPSTVTDPATTYGQYWNYYSQNGQLSYVADL